VIADCLQCWATFKLWNIFVFDIFLNVERRNKVEGLLEIRFSRIIFFLRLAGIHFKMKKMSTLNAIYMINVTVCTCSTFLGMFVDVYLHRVDMRHTTTNIRDLTEMTSVVWISKSGKNYGLFASTGRQNSSQFLYYIYGHAGANSAELVIKTKTKINCAFLLI